MTSENWSGYVAGTSLTDPESDSVSAVSGSWVVPAVTSSSSRGSTYSAIWVGIDGYSDDTVEQIGTSQNVVNGVAQYQVWYEMYSTGKQQPEQLISSVTIEPGDDITASVTYVTSGQYAGDFELTIDDTSRANDSFTTYQSSAATQSPGADRSSAEWIVEAPSSGNSILGLANFGSVTFTNASATINGVTAGISGPTSGSTAWQSEAIDMATARGSLEDTTSVLTDSGSSFVVTYDGSSSASGSNNRFGRDVGVGAVALHAVSVSSGQPATTPPQYLVYGLTPFSTSTPSKRFGSGSSGSSSSSVTSS